jgi:hypothetical protein
MSVYDTTAAVVKVWGHLQTLPQPTDTLEGIWSGTGSTFYPDACRKLIQGILKAFPGATNLKKNVRYTLIKDSAVNPNGIIDTVAALAEAILQSLETSEVVFLPPTVAKAAR